jgi:hypothetical protein
LRLLSTYTLETDDIFRMMWYSALSYYTQRLVCVLELNVLQETLILTKEDFLLIKSFYIDQFNKLKGRDKRIFAAHLALALGRGGQVFTTEQLPNLLEDIKSIVDSQSQTDLNFHSTRLFTRLTVAEIRCQLIAKKSYTDEELPSNQTLNTKVNQMGYGLKKVQKTKPLKKINPYLHNVVFP